MVKFNDEGVEKGSVGRHYLKKILTFSKGGQHFRTAVKLNGRFSNCPLPFLAVTRHGAWALRTPFSMVSRARDI